MDWRNPDYAAIFAGRAEKLSRIRLKPEMLPALLAYYKDNPAQFIIDWGCTFDPRNAERGLPPLIPFILFPKQVDWINWCVDKWKNQKSDLTVKSRDMGLSWLAVALGCSLSITHDDLVIGYGSRKEEYVDKIGSPKSLFHKARLYTSLLPPELRGGFDMATTAPHMRIMFPNTGSIMVGEAGDGIGRGDRASMYFVDESAFLDRPMLVEASLSQTTNCRIDISTPNGMDNPFAEKIMSGRFEVFRFHWRDDPRKDQDWYETQKLKLDPVTIAQEIDIDFAASVDGVLIPSEWVQSAIDAHVKLEVDLTGERKATLDVADLGKDKNAQSFVDGLLLFDVDEWHGSTTEDIFGTTQKAIDNCDKHGITILDYDSDGLGSGVRGDARVVNEMRVDQGLNEIEVHAFHGGAAVVNPEDEYIEGRQNKDFFENLKAQAWWLLRDRFKATHDAVEYGKPFDENDIISISSACSHLNRLTSELSRPTYKKSSRGKIIVNKQPDGAASPNLADSVMMAYAPKEIERQMMGLFIPKRHRGR